MNYRMFSAAAALTAAMFVSSPVWAAKNSEEITHDGKFVSLVAEKLTMTNAKQPLAKTMSWFTVESKTHLYSVPLGTSQNSPPF